MPVASSSRHLDGKMQSVGILVNKGISGDGEPSTEEISVSKGARRIKSRSLAALGRNVYIFSVGHSPKFNSSHYQLIAVVWDHQEIPLSSVTFKYSPDIPVSPPIGPQHVT